MRFACWDLECTHLRANFGYVLCGAVKELGQEPRLFRIDQYPHWKKGGRHLCDDSRLVHDIADALEEYDVWVTYFGKGFDVKFLRTRLLLNEQPPLVTKKHIDLYFQARGKLLLHSNRLAVVSEVLPKVKHAKTKLEPKFWMWAGCGDGEALDYVVEHCLADVEVLEETYWQLAPFIERVTK